jgi:gliding motility associated protien GldN
MKRINQYIAAAVLSFGMVVPMMAQNNKAATTQQQRRSPVASRATTSDQQKNAQGNSSLTVRAENFNEGLTQQIGNARWMRVIYRQLDLTAEQNAPLYYPTQPMNGQMNLFSIIFKLLSENKIKAYEYLDGYEAFDDTHLVKFKDLLDRFYILYDAVPSKTNRRDTTYEVNESDVPSADVKSYYVKEAWYFDQNNSIFDVKTLAICPILTSSGDESMGETRMPMFWLPYENIRPYINTTLIMTSNENNAMTFTIDDYFRRRMFKGDIIKTQNLMNQPLSAYASTPDSLKMLQDSIETKLANFEKKLWIEPDSTQNLATTKNGKKTKLQNVTVKGQKTSSTKPTKQPKAAKVKSAATKSNSSATRSVRNRRR